MKRLSGASKEIAAAWQYYEYMVVNDDLEQAITETIQTIDGKGVKKHDRRT
jgi:guanylate kinase